MSGVPDDDLSKFIAASEASDAASSARGGKPFKARLLPLDEETVLGGAKPDVLVYSRGPRPWLKFCLQLATILVAGAVGWYSAAGTGVSKEIAGKYATSDAVQALTAHMAAEADATRQREAAAATKQANELAALRKAVETIGRNVDGIRTAQQQPRTDADREMARKELAQKIDRLAERLDRLEQQTSAQMPTASIARPAAAPAQASIAPQAPSPPVARVAAKPAQSAQAAAGTGKPVRSPPPGGYVLGEVYNGGAVVHGHRGPVDVWPGAMLPGAGRVQAILRRNGQWVVTTTDGEIDSDGY